MQQTRKHKAVTRRAEAKKLLSRRKQSECSLTPKGNTLILAGSNLKPLDHKVRAL